MQKMKRVSSLAVLALSLMLVAACNKTPDASSGPAESPASTSTQAQVYTCPMHPEVQQAAPGQCPICGMDLVLKQ